METLIRTMFGPSTRIVLRYGIGFAAAKGILPSGLAEALSSDPTVVNSLEMGMLAIAAGGVERIYTVAKKRGWAL